MTRDEWLRVKNVAASALELPEASRGAFVEAACAGDRSLQQESSALVIAVARAASLWEAPALLHSITAADLDAATRPASWRPGATLGPYRIVREIGRGGMGTVFQAERADDEYRQIVALKVAHDSRSPTLLNWFRDERQILATLDHPSIARLMDGGTTGEGVPYLVMEFVEGLPIDDYCDAHRLGTAERLALFRQVCAAVDFAHRHLVVHRDLKPRNILVAGGVPKLLDFGIATRLDPGGDRAAAIRPDTGAAPWMVTPEYASPEQLQDGPVTTATDVYALGVLLYRLLTGRSPYRTASNAAQDLLIAICQQDPLLPSLATEDKNLRRRLKGDLDTIVLMAMKKEPSARYASAAQFADDLDRHLQQRPVMARPATVRYHAGRFLARHTFGAVAATLIVASLAGGLTTTTLQVRESNRQRARAERYFADVRRLASSLIFELHDGIENLPGAIPARQLLVRRALDYFDRLAVDERGNHELQREVAVAYDKLAGVLGRPYAQNLGNSAAALSSYRKALAIREQLAREVPSREAQFDLWSSHFSLGTLLGETADTSGALTEQRKAREVLEALLLVSPHDDELLRAAARTEVGRAHTFEQAGRIDDALASAQRALSLDQQLLARSPLDDALRSDVAADYGRVGIALLKIGDRDASLMHLHQRLSVANQLAAQHPANVAFQRNLSTAHVQLGQAYGAQGRLAASKGALLAALSIRQALAAQEPENRQAAIDVMFARMELGQLAERSGDRLAAAAHLEAALEACEAFVAADPDYVFFRLSLASTLLRSAQNLTTRGHAPDGALRLQRALDILNAAAAADPTDARVQFEIALAWSVAGDIAAAGVPLDVPNDDVSGGDRTAAWWYRRSAEAMMALRASGRLAGGTLNGAEGEKLAEVRRKLIAKH